MLTEAKQIQDGIDKGVRFTTPFVKFDTFDDILGLKVEADAADGLINFTLAEQDKEGDRVVAQRNLTVQIDTSHVDDIIEALQLLKKAAGLNKVAR